VAAASVAAASVGPCVRLGTQGWSYPDWVGSFYPSGTRADRFLARYAEEFATVEIDSTFYGTPLPRAFRRWRASVPERFRFSLKMPREITHERRMLGTRELMRAFYDVARELGPTLGCVLVQFEASFGRTSEPEFWREIEHLPSDLRTAVEFRDPAWYVPEVQRRLNERGIALAVTDAPFVPREILAAALARDAAPFAYVRWVGDRDAVARYDRVRIDRRAALAWWGRELRPLASAGRTVYGYVNNHYEGHSPATVRTLYASLGIAHAMPAEPEQTSLFG